MKPNPYNADASAPRDFLIQNADYQRCILREVTEGNMYLIETDIDGKHEIFFNFTRKGRIKNVLDDLAVMEARGDASIIENNIAYHVGEIYSDGVGTAC